MTQYQTSDHKFVYSRIVKLTSPSPSPYCDQNDSSSFYVTSDDRFGSILTVGGCRKKVEKIFSWQEAEVRQWIAIWIFIPERGTGYNSREL